ncbi:MAG: alpha/beta hydrolase-fold protein [Brevundimonas sp.]|uniref:alpha/beta hydrolase n=1 Tax=Brevundimonas sp. TaxID=1871086 RepID=UPI002732DA03|nr:alpha/beta hydrolase-fold protein [Brevundimonas sp.]MDP3405548.1 alpha/beta hydrolase-fold protein [Brevundimonas sp.]
MPNRLAKTGLLIVLTALGACTEPAQSQTQISPAAQRGGGAPYEVLGTQVWNVPDPISGRDYQVFVHLPPSYEREPGRRYPVLYVTDADYAFPVIRQIGRRLNGEGPRIEEFILVGLSYAVGDDPVASRTRDYTATRSDRTARIVNGGGGGTAYQAYLKAEVLPFVEDRFRADPAQRILLGHSYGGLLGAQVLFSEPELFSAYVLGSPSLWHGRDAIFTAEAAYGQSHTDLPATVYMYIGEYETVGDGPRYNRNHDMVADNRRFETQLRSRNYPGLTLTSEVLNDEDHLSVAPRGFTRALMTLLPAR